MRKLLLLAVVALSGCTAIDAYLLAKFDPAEYDIITDIRFKSEKYINQCNDPVASKTNANTLADRTYLFELYSADLPHNGETIKASTALNEIAQGLAKKYNDGEQVSPLFCKLKFEGIQHSADTIRGVIAKRPR